MLDVPGKQPNESLNKYGQVTKTNDFKDIIPSHLRFIKKVAYSNSSALNVPKKTLQQHKLIGKGGAGAGGMKLTLFVNSSRLIF